MPWGPGPSLRPELRAATPLVCVSGMWAGRSLAGMGSVGTTGSLPGCATVFFFDFWPRQVVSLSVMVSHHPAVIGTLGLFVGLWTVWGLSLQVGDFSLNIYLTQLIFGAVEVPACYSSIFMMQWFGRKWTQLGTLVLGGLVCIAIIFIPASIKAGSPPTPSSLTRLCQRPIAFLSRVEGFPGAWVRKG